MKKIYIGIICASLMLIVGNIAQAAEGDVWIAPTTQEIGANTNFDIDVHIDTGGKNLGAFNMYLDFDPTKITIDTIRGVNPSLDTGKGFDKGLDTINYIMTSNSGDIANGHFRFAGITANGYANGNNKHLITIHVKTMVAEGTTSLSLRVNELSDDFGHVLTAGNITGAIATVADITAPTITEVTPVTTPTNDITPDYSFSSDEVGTITYGGDCSSSTTSVVAGNNTITFNPLLAGTHNNCTITVTDSAGNISGVLNVTSFDTTTSTCIGVSSTLEQNCIYTSVNTMDVNKIIPKIKVKHFHKKYKLHKKKTLYLRKKKLSFKARNQKLVNGRVQLFINGKLKRETIVGTNGEWKLNKKFKKNGKYKLKFKYFNSAGNFLGQSYKYKVKIDTKKPKFIHLSAFFSKKAGDKVVFRATDRKKTKKVKTGIKYYKYYFLGKKHKTKKPEFIIPVGTLKGLYTLKVRAYDKAGNKITKIIVVRVR